MGKTLEDTEDSWNQRECNQPMIGRYWKTLGKWLENNWKTIGRKLTDD